MGLYGWKRSAALTIDYTKVAAAQTDFPVLLIWNGTSGNLPQEVYNASSLSPKSDGSDIRFSSDATGDNELAFEIVTFSPNANTANARVKIWVKLPTVSSTADTTFYMWWGNPNASAYAATDPYGRNAVWSNGFIGVFHLNESSGSTATNAVGSNNGTFNGTTFPNRVDTPYGGMQNFQNANGNYVSLGSGSPWAITGNLTISAIVTVTSWTATWQAIVAKGDGTYRIARNGSNNYPGFDRTTSGGNQQSYNTTPINSGYNHVAGTFSTSAGSYTYVNGSPGSVNSNTDATLSDSTVLCIGRNTAYTSRDWNGYIGEVKISNVVRSASWMSTEYNTTINFASFVSAGTPTYTGYYYNTLFPIGWTRVCALKIDRTKVPSTQTNVSLPFVWNGTSGNLPAEVYNASALSPASDGRDLRFTSDIDGKNMLPIEVDVFQPNANVANARVKLFTKVPTVSSTEDTVIYLWWRNTNAIAIPHTDTYGRNAVWSDYRAVWHMSGTGDVVDSTGNGYTAVNNGTTAGSSPLGAARSFNGASRQYLQVNGLLESQPTVRITALVSATALDSSGSDVFSIGDYVMMRLDASSPWNVGSYRYSSAWRTTAYAGVNTVNGGFYVHNYAVKPSKSFQIRRLNENYQQDSYTDAIVYSGLGSNTFIGRHGNGNEAFDFTGVIGELRVENRIISHEWAVMMSNSLLNPAAFAIADVPKTPATVGLNRAFNRGFEDGFNRGFDRI